ncbi:DUF2922 domain-containing protein [Romboutsia maritimum]|uniref:DUF2922 domain-containing protein n=1 Tax=Romboutsia maritimum TaxID=2020948 RepID=A0A255HYH8_9FIRM|nr:DUF2922 domain-containing protein [Romboutsia maritimum]RDY22364.1 DUF2922 domain-containing protein [Romboutsia maritimum]
MPKKETKLLMTFSGTAGKKFSIAVPDPKEDLTEAQIKESMEFIISKNIFAPSFGEDLQSALEAKVVQTRTTDYDLIVS